MPSMMKSCLLLTLRCCTFRSRNAASPPKRACVAFFLAARSSASVRGLLPFSRSAWRRALTSRSPIVNVPSVSSVACAWAAACSRTAAVVRAAVRACAYACADAGSNFVPALLLGLLIADRLTVVNHHVNNFVRETGLRHGALKAAVNSLTGLLGLAVVCDFDDDVRDHFDQHGTSPVVSVVSRWRGTLGSNLSSLPLPLVIDAPAWRTCRDHTEDRRLVQGSCQLIG